jgi:hypothetical protein
VWVHLWVHRVVLQPRSSLSESRKMRKEGRLPGGHKPAGRPSKEEYEAAIEYIKTVKVEDATKEGVWKAFKTVYDYLRVSKAVSKEARSRKPDCKSMSEAKYLCARLACMALEDRTTTEKQQETWDSILRAIGDWGAAYVDRESDSFESYRQITLGVIHWAMEDIDDYCRGVRGGTDVVFCFAEDGTVEGTNCRAPEQVVEFTRYLAIWGKCGFSPPPPEGRTRRQATPPTPMSKAMGWLRDAKTLAEEEKAEYDAAVKAERATAERVAAERAAAGGCGEVVDATPVVAVSKEGRNKQW